MAPLPVFDAHRIGLRAAFIERLLQEQPKSVLDVGAGDGALVAGLTRRGVEASGIEASEDLVRRATAKGRPIELGAADALSHPAGSFDWVTLRHVLHHLTDPERALAEAARVARRGVLVAEPTTETGMPGHEAMWKLDQLLRRLDRSHGAIHGDNLAVGQIVSWLPEDFDAELLVLAPPSYLPREEVQALIERSTGGMALGDHDRGEAHHLVGEADRGGVLASGSAMLVAIRRVSR